MDPLNQPLPVPEINFTTLQYLSINSRVPDEGEIISVTRLCGVFEIGSTGLIISFIILPAWVKYYCPITSNSSHTLVINNW